MNTDSANPNTSQPTLARHRLSRLARRNARRPNLDSADAYVSSSTVEHETGNAGLNTHAGFKRTVKKTGKLAKGAGKLILQGGAAILDGLGNATRCLPLTLGDFDF
jgi:hypothetical protein